MHYLSISFTHRNSTMEIREKLSYTDDEDKKGCLTRLVASENILEVILIATCNRIEVLCYCDEIPKSTQYIFDKLSCHSGISIEELEGRADVFNGSSAIHHLFSVASSLDSMVIGETQIVGQLKDAFRFAYDNKYCSKKLARAMKSAFKCAAKVRNTTNISSKPVSMASVAVNKMKSLVDDVTDKKALVIGVGEISEITAKHLISAGADVYIMNRTQYKAEALAKECNAKTIPFSKLADAVNEFEILYTATSAYDPIITDAIIHSKDFDRYWFDLALPRDIHYNKGERINLFVIDDLKVIVDENVSAREEASREADNIIGREVVVFFEWLNNQNIEPLIKEIYNRAQDAAQEESERAVVSGYIPKEYQNQAQKMCEQALKRFLHEYTTSMRNASEDTHIELMSGVMASIMKDKDLKI